MEDAKPKEISQETIELALSQSKHAITGRLWATAWGGLACAISPEPLTKIVAGVAAFSFCGAALCSAYGHHKLKNALQPDGDKPNKPDKKRKSSDFGMSYMGIQ
jgi:hypothetical protein